LWDKLNSLTFKPSLIHRIDRDTSWILMIWKKKDMLTRLVNDLKDHDKVKKTYYAIVLWKLSRKKGTIKKNLLRIENAQNENKVQVSEKWQTAISHYKVLKEHILQTDQGVLILSEVEIKIETGRMHQIRVHMASLWNPIVWDKAYWDKKLNSFFERNYGLKRQALHSWKIEFYHYGREKTMELEARIKDDLIDFIERIKG
jgi:23S rRNA-/tRNA-specific pseudouridylate synthase